MKYCIVRMPSKDSGERRMIYLYTPAGPRSAKCLSLEMDHVAAKLGQNDEI